MENQRNKSIEALIEEKYRYKQIMGIDTFYASDITEILNECWEQNLDVTRKDILAEVNAYLTEQKASSKK